MNEKMPESVQQELTHMAEVDQNMRNQAMQGAAWDDSVDKVNTENLKTIIKTHGWPTISKVGVEGSHAAWLIAQHADHDVEFQSHCLGLMQQEPLNELNVTNLAYLEDRVRVNQGQPQLYGTQFFQQDKNSELKPRPIEDQEHLDERRAKVGLDSFASYQKKMEEIARTRKH